MANEFQRTYFKSKSLRKLNYVATECHFLVFLNSAVSSYSQKCNEDRFEPAAERRLQDAKYPIVFGS